MFFDDRLATVLRQRATGEGGLRTQYRQLLDLMGKVGAGAHGQRDPSLMASAWLRMDALAETIPAEARARMIREPGWRFRSPELAAHLAEQEPAVASAALTRAELSAEDWTSLIPHLPVRARGFLRLRRDLPVDVESLLERLGVHDRGLPAPEVAPMPGAAPHPAVADRPAAVPLPDRAAPASPVPLRVVSPEPSLPPPAPPFPRDRARRHEETGRTEISALVERIAQFRRTRSESQQEIDTSPRLPLGEVAERAPAIATGFGFAADTAGRIAWASGEVAPMVIGTRLFTPNLPNDDAGADNALERAFARRQPIAGAGFSLAGAPAIAGNWIIDAQPHFSEDGHFAGYVGRMRREPAPAGAPLRPEAREADRIRQLLHELRTPVTAVQGYAEVIQQQLFGPAPHEYRALAAAIAADAARILAGFDELDRLARLETGVLAIDPGETDLAALVRRTAAQLAPVLEPHGAGMTLAFAPTTALLIAIDPDDAEALIWRLLASIGAACGSGETITISLDALIGPGAAMARLACTLPHALAAQDNPFAAAAPRTRASAISPGLFSTGFALRLARAEARAAGGALEQDGELLALSLPLLTDYSILPSADSEGVRATGA